MALTNILPLNLEGLVAAGKAAGGLRQRAAEELEHQMHSARRLMDPVRTDVEMAIRYCANAWVYSADRGHELQSRPEETDSFAFALLLARNLRDAQALFGALREDEDGFGTATFLALLRALSEPWDVDLAQDPRSDPVAAFAECSQAFPRDVAVIRSPADFLRTLRPQLKRREQALFLTRQHKMVALLRGIYPMVVEQQLFVARCVLELGHAGSYGSAAEHGLEMSRLFFKRVGHAIDARPELYDGIVKQLLRLIEAVELRGASDRSLATHLAAIETQRYGVQHAGSQAAHRRLARIR